MTEQLPEDIVDILEHLAAMAAGYGNHLKWNEEAMLKADLMANRHYWTGFPSSAVKAKCLALGMRPEDASLVAGLVAKAQEGRRLVPQRSYRDSTFRHERPQSARRTSRDWEPLDEGSGHSLRTPEDW